MPKLTDTVDKIPLVGPKYKEILGKLGVTTIEDLLFYFPVSHADTSDISTISELNTIEKKTVLVNVESIRNIRTKFGKFITEGVVSDESGKIDVIWFNQPFLKRNLPIGSTILLNGKLNPKRNKPQLYSPQYEQAKSADFTHLGTISPIYPLTDGITSKWLRSRIKFLIKKLTYLLDSIKDPLPQTIKECYELMPLKDAIVEIHFPTAFKSLEKSKKRLAFDELLNIQLKLVDKIQKRKALRAPAFHKYKEEVDKFLKRLDFEPTKAQLKAIKEILGDLKKEYPANRLLQGDVGCGKTLVAAAVSIPVMKSGYQVALMAPTAILAKQHYETLKGMLKDYKLRLVTGNTKEQSHQLSADSYQLIIGTHALLHRQDDLFSKLGLLIVDEQHRFGVEQRNLLVSQGKGKNKTTPHKITMTATPIPRSIALTLFGDLDISIIDEMPEGRLPTKTYLVPQRKRKDSYNWIKSKIKDESLQVFWLCPLIEESEKLQTKAVITEYEKLETEIFPNLRIDLLHGRLTEDEKNEKILRMKQDKTDILVSTSVIEVGMDVPNASIIVIEGAERFGLAQLHQLRGRVGRRAKQESWCFLFTSKNTSQDAIKRLKYFSRVNDGLKVANFDLANRGPGEVYGTKQAGIPDLKIANLGDIKLIKETREAAEKIFNK
ncbi:ATP-dependent DNA helicase RecG [Candidatus Dojkabacteria bacterium]|nr:ATP-dependent DNA helicase RecG [Candidatus Dojkabacteria bacterium]